MAKALRELTLTLRAFGQSYQVHQKNELWCAGGVMAEVRKFFVLPIYPKVLYLLLLTTPARDREEFEVLPYRNYGAELHSTSGRTISRDDLDRILFPLIGRRVYLEVWYED